MSITHSIKSSPKSWAIAAACTIVVLVLGFLFVISRAGGQFVSIEAEQGLVSGDVTVISDADASALKAIQYSSGPATSPGGGTGAAKLLKPYGLGISPYAYIPWEGSMNDVRVASGVKNYVAAFVLSTSTSSCTPAWDGDTSLGLSSARSTEIANDISKLRSNGGDVMLSFGGAAGVELANGCSSVAALKQAYRSVIDKYSLTKIDFDLEGTNATNAAGNSKRADALLELQKDLPNLKIWLTLAVEQNGLTSSGLSVINQLRDKGVVISGINIMAMDYGTGVTQMGQAAINAAQATFTQLKSIYPSNIDAEIWKAIGVTAMIGINDTQPETFTLKNAQELYDFAVQKGIGMLSEWNTARDKACAGNAATLSDSCSGVSQTNYQFMKAMSIPAAL